MPRQRFPGVGWVRHTEEVLHKTGGVGEVSEEGTAEGSPIVPVVEGAGPVARVASHRVLKGVGGGHLVGHVTVLSGDAL